MLMSPFTNIFIHMYRLILSSIVNLIQNQSLDRLYSLFLSSNWRFLKDSLKWGHGDILKIRDSGHRKYRSYTGNTLLMIIKIYSWMSRIGIFILYQFLSCKHFLHCLLITYGVWGIRKLDYTIGNIYVPSSIRTPNLYICIRR